jgi:hypothetical protein
MQPQMNADERRRREHWRRASAGGGWSEETHRHEGAQTQKQNERRDHHTETRNGKEEG